MSAFGPADYWQIFSVLILFAIAIIDFDFKKKKEDGHLTVMGWLLLLGIILSGISSFFSTIYKIEADKEGYKIAMDTSSATLRRTNQILDSTGTTMRILDNLKHSTENLNDSLRSTNQTANELLIKNRVMYTNMNKSNIQSFKNYNKRFVATCIEIFNTTDKANFSRTVDTTKLIEEIRECVNRTRALLRSEFDNPVLYNHPAIDSMWKAHETKMNQLRWNIEGYDIVSRADLMTSLINEATAFRTFINGAGINGEEPRLNKMKRAAGIPID